MCILNKIQVAKHNVYLCITYLKILDKAENQKTVDWFDPLAVQDSLESSLAPQFASISSLLLRLLYGPALTFIHDYWKNHSFDYMDFCQ